MKRGAERTVLKRARVCPLPYPNAPRMPRGAAQAVKGRFASSLDRAAFRGLWEASGRRASLQEFDGLRRVEQRAWPNSEIVHM